MQVSRLRDTVQCACVCVCARACCTRRCGLGFRLTIATMLHCAALPPSCDGCAACQRRGSQYPNASQWQYRVSASDWRDPATYHFGTATRDNNIFPELAKLDGNEGGNCGIEDPSLWVDDAGVVHAIFHNYRAGGHAASPDNGATWHWYGGNCSQAAGRPSIDWSRSAWPKNITFRGDGSTTSSRQVHRRERPHILT